MEDDGVKIASDWYAKAFNDLYPVVYAHRTVEAARDEALFSIEVTGLNTGDAVLDLCCGNGRHLAHLCGATGCAAGLDYSPQLLAIARETLGDQAKLVRADMRHHPFDGVFDVVMNYFTSMGYFEEDAQNRLVAESIARSLKPGGRFFIDYLNADYTAGHLKPETTREQDGYVIHEIRWIDTGLHRINKTMRVSRGDETVSESGESVRLYDRDEFVALLSAGGLVVDEVYGGYGDIPFGPEHPRMIAVGRKAA